MENGLKIRVSRMFRSSFGSCRTRNLSDVMEKAVFSPPRCHSPSSHLVEPMSPRLRPFPSIFRPKSSDSLQAPPCFDSFCDNEFGFAQKVKESASKKKDSKRTTKTKKKKNAQKKINHKETTLFSYGTKYENDFGGNWWYSSYDEDEDDETETLFSSKSTSSDSSQSRRRRRGSRRRKHDYGGGRVSSEKGNSEMGGVPLQVKVRDSFAVVKRSSDPYNDFRTSMVEMIVEKQIVAPKDLKNLLQCFLSLNSYQHHKIIVEVFTEIFDALFSHWL
ncbi:hypothetical protein QN277_000670 [Acacia crassicarpa]|uniref:Transcription repressor n=1 Tax=Acacia crassicarpa TaxID=499986 RepID=A0AAE1N6Y3_9FABA|nr:hypothetical protein QN277_000670 [Acacia crassicarpa]